MLVTAKTIAYCKQVKLASSCGIVWIISECICIVLLHTTPGCSGMKGDVMAVAVIASQQHMQQRVSRALMV